MPAANLATTKPKALFEQISLSDYATILVEGTDITLVSDDLDSLIHTGITKAGIRFSGIQVECARTITMIYPERTAL
jgi:hypothetical protein